MSNDKLILDFIDNSDFSRAEVLITLQTTLNPVSTSRGKLKTEDYAEIMKLLNLGSTNKELALQYKVTSSRISEIKTGKSIPANAFRSYLEVKYAN